MNNSNPMFLLLPLVPLVGWGLMGIFISKISKVVGEYASGFLILLFSLFFVLLGWPIFAKGPFNINWLTFAGLGLIGATTYLFVNKAYKTGYASVVAPIVGTWGALSATLGVLFYGESFGIYKLISIVAILAGIFLISTNGKFSFNFRKHKMVEGAGFALLVAVGYGVLFFLLGKVSRDNGWYITSVVLQLFNVLFLFLILLPKLKTKKMSLKKIPWKYLFLAGAVDAASVTTYNLAVTRLEVSYVSVIASASPLVTILIASIYLKEKTTRIQRFGIMLAIGGIILLQIFG